MTKASYIDLKMEAKARMKGHFGEAFLAIIVIPLVFSIGSSLISLLFTNLDVIDFIIQFFITVLIQYIGIMLVLKLIKGQFHGLFTNLFGNSKGYLNMLIYLLILNIIFIIPSLIYIDFSKDFAEYYNSLPANHYPDFNELRTAFLSFLPNISLIITSIILSLIGLVIGIRLFFTPYLIVDKEMKAIDAIKLSWHYSKDNFFRIFFFPFSFILWYLVIFMTCGLILIYLIPYITLSMGYMYKAILIENDDYPAHLGKTDIAPSVVDPLAEEKSEDPFDSYYE